MRNKHDVCSAFPLSLVYGLTELGNEMHGSRLKQVLQFDDTLLLCITDTWTLFAEFSIADLCSLSILVDPLRIRELGGFHMSQEAIDELPPKFSHALLFQSL
jgi:hypothetical protein